MLFSKTEENKKNAAFWDVILCEPTLNTIPARRHIPEDGILHSHRRENLKSYTEENKLTRVVFYSGP
jgi:hypothetical protein